MQDGNDVCIAKGETVAEEPKYVVVAENEESERIELPLHPDDNSLSLTTLVHTFPGASGLKFKNQTTGASRALLMDPLGTRFLPPADGWNGKTFFVIFQHRQAGDQNTKRKKMMDECDDDDDYEDVIGGRGSQLTAKQKRMEAETPLAEKTCIDLIVLGLPFKTTAETCREYFKTFGDVVLFDLKMDQGVSRGYGFVRMADLEAQKKILDKEFHEIDGRRCQVKVPQSKGETWSMNITRVFVGRIQEKTTAEDLRQFFTDEAEKIDPNAAVTDVFIPRPFRSFAFVNFTSANVAKAMIKKGDFIIDGGSVVVSAAAPRETDYSQRMGGGGANMYGGQSSYGRKMPMDPYGGYDVNSSPFPYDQMVKSGSQWKSSTYRGAEGRASNRYTPGYAPGTRYSVAGGRAGTSQALASGLDALNLNKMSVNPDVMEAAWQAFWNTVNSSAANPPPQAPGNTKW